MTHSRIATRRAAALSTAVLVASLLSTGAFAQSIPSKPKDGAPAAAKKKDSAEAQKFVASGIKSYETGKLDAAVTALSEGLRLGGLPSQQMAKALYIRGLAYRKQGKPALAISDLTSAVWLKGGLSETERSDAMENRVAAYREAGLGDGVTGPRPQQQKSAAAPASSGGWQTATLDPSSAVTTSPASSSSSPSFGLAQSDSAPSQPSSSGTSIGGFFNNLFGSSSSSAASSVPAATEPAASPPPQPKSVAAAAAAEGWGDATKVSKSRTETRVATAGPVAAPAPAPQVAPAAAGKFKLQVAAVRSRADAEAVATKLKTQHAAQLQSREPVVDEAVYGNMGTFYRVRIGPYADANEPKQLCASLKGSGFDCMVVTK